MVPWTRGLRLDPLPALLAIDVDALRWRVRRDLLGEREDARTLWDARPVQDGLRRQRQDGSWSYPGTRTHAGTAYDLLATYEALLPLVAKHGLDVRHPAIPRAADFVFSFQSDEGDLRGMYGNQYSPNYTAAVLAVLLDAGHPHHDPRIEKAMRWLLDMRQDDGGWAIPFRTVRAAGTRSYNAVMRFAHPLQPDRSRPFSHFVTGIVLRAFAAHPRLRSAAEAISAARLLGSRLFKPDAYPDRRAAVYWEKFRYPFRWTDVVSALDAMLLTGVSGRDPAVAGALGWLAEHQLDTGLWRSPYAKAADRDVHLWSSFAVARVFRRAHDG